MSLYGIWSAFGFRDNPYSQATLGADETGDFLLVGRDTEVSRLQAAIGSGGTHPAVEGPVGAGKSSLISVAAYRMYRTSSSAATRELWLPATKLFQAQTDLDGFVTDVIRTVAQTLIKYKDSFEGTGLDKPDLAKIDGWLNSPQYSNRSFEASVLGSGGGFSKGSEPNTSEGFAQTGFTQAVLEQLDRCLPQGTGGVICVLDNLELLESAGQARATLDELRDRLFNVPQLRWVLCGSRGIVSRARSQRLSGIFQAPMTVMPLDHASAIAAIDQRIEFYGVDGAKAPVTPRAFDFLYQALNFNLRDAMSTAQEFSQWLHSNYIGVGRPIPESDERDQLLEAWLAERAESAFRDAGGVQPRHWQFFLELAAAGGTAASSEFERFGFGKQQQFTSAVTQLVQANLVVRETDPDNAVRTLNTITALGWLVHFHKANYQMPAPRAGRPAAP